jgi:hypothetical protein
MQGQPNSLPFYTKLDSSKPIALVRLMLQRIDSDPLASGTACEPAGGSAYHVQNSAFSCLER